ncbi:hypothetical protein GWI72_14855 [Microvirga tunisiensis]|uniref:Uncharacterized protein n=2 Tax=Pannonibacter tanglangensis TaxID=2750084 RepID=A0A7X5F4D7_9HYPH|nr:MULTISPECIES: hypothetical protein [unclassified Pannonibacter]NBN66046.1 hypothetical protein [Pannonibacter sp. XCT-34]NBN79553.1 hypothetical protein [Pannonibacter sp. XCT-53]
MRSLKKSAAVLALCLTGSVAASGVAMACSHMKSVKATPNMTVAQLPATGQTQATGFSIATSDVKTAAPVVVQPAPVAR